MDVSILDGRFFYADSKPLKQHIDERIGRSRSTAASRSNLTRTLYLDGMSVDESREVLVPNFATSIQHVVGGSTTVEMFDGLKQCVYMYSGNSVMSVPLSNDVMSVKIKNTSGISTDIRCVFGLAL